MRKNDFVMALKAEVNEAFKEKAEERSYMKGEIVKPMYLTTDDAKIVVDAIGDVILNTLPNEEVIFMNGLTLYTSTREPRIGYNPLTGENFTIPAQRHPRAKFGTPIRDAVSLD